jgi:CheY-like chemotaxis protein
MSARILIADDEPIQQRLLETLCHRFGYEAETVGSGQEALARLNSPGTDPIALLILDVVMPDLDGMARRFPSSPSPRKAASNRRLRRSGQAPRISW